MKAGPEIYENAVCPICSKTVKEGAPGYSAERTKETYA